MGAETQPDNEKAAKQSTPDVVEERRVALVVVDIDVPHLDHPFEYLVSEDQRVSVGSQVEVRFGGRKIKGWVTGVSATSASGRKLAPLLRVLGPFPLISPGVLETARYLAKRYATSLNQVLAFAAPARRASEEKRVVTKLKSEVSSDQNPCEPGENEKLTKCVRRGVSTLYPGQMESYVLAAVERPLSMRRQVIVVMPTSAEVDLLARHIAQQNPRLRVGVATGTSSPQTRYRVHLEAAAGLLDMVIGTRSAVWSPMPNLGALIIWDDGDDRLRERRAPRFDALDIAVARSLIEGVDLLTCSYSRSVKSQMLVRSGWAQDVSPPRDENLPLIPKVRIFDWYSAQQEGPEGSMRLPAAAYSLIREGLRTGPVLVQVAAAGYETPIPCPECGQPAEEKLDDCAHPSHEYEARLRIGSERVREDLARAFSGVEVRVSSSTGGMLRTIEQGSQIIVATSGSEPLVEGGYSAVVITEAEGLAYLDELWAPLEAARRWFNALALSSPGAPAMLIGSFNETTQRAVVQWRPRNLAEQVLEERVELGFPPARWVVAITGSIDATPQIRELVARLSDNESSSGTLMPDVAIIVDQPSEPAPAQGGKGDDEERGHLVVSAVPKRVTALMKGLWDLQVDRSAKKLSLLELEVNPPRIAPR